MIQKGLRYVCVLNGGISAIKMDCPNLLKTNCKAML